MLHDALKNTFLWMKAEYQVILKEIVMHHLFRGRHRTPELILITTESYFKHVTTPIEYIKGACGFYWLKLINQLD